MPSILFYNLDVHIQMHYINKINHQNLNLPETLLNYLWSGRSHYIKYAYNSKYIINEFIFQLNYLNVNVFCGGGMMFYFEYDSRN